jgi:hypothetical protein
VPAKLADAAAPSLAFLLQQLKHHLVVGLARLQAALVASNEDQLSVSVGTNTPQCLALPFTRAFLMASKQASALVNVC